MGTMLNDDLYSSSMAGNKKEMQRGLKSTGAYGWVSGNGTLIFLSIQAVLTSILKKRFSVWKEERASS